MKKDFTIRKGLEMKKNTAMVTDIKRLISQLISGPLFPENYFSYPGCSFAGLYDMAENLALKLRTDNPSGKPVCLFTQDRPLMAAGLIAGLKTGTSFLLPHALSRAAFNQLLQAADFDLVIRDKTCSIPEHIRCITADKAENTIISGNFNAPMEPDRPWVYLYTGGSTGRPELWSKTPRNLLMEAAYLVQRFDIGPKDRILATIAPYHIYGLLYSLLVPLLSSSAVVEQTPGFPDEIISALETSKASIMVSVPVHYRSLKNKSVAKQGLRLAFSSAGPLSPEDGDAFSSETGCGIYEIYGSTETGGIASRCRVKGETALLPFDCMDVKIETGRLFIRSEFVSHELPTTPDGYFKVPDRVASAGDGRFVVTGRTDSIIKVGGKRVDLEDVKAAILKISGVGDAVVLSRPAASARGNEILALVEGHMAADDIIKGLEKELEPYALPRWIKTVEKIPMVATGKVDRRAVTAFFE